MSFFSRFFGKSAAQRTASSPPLAKATPIEESSARSSVAAPASDSAMTQDLLSVIRKRASAIGIPPNTVQDATKHLSPDDVRLLAECPDNFFMVYLWSPPGTKAKADAARDIGLGARKATSGAAAGVVTSAAAPAEAGPSARTRPGRARRAAAGEHYVLRCADCSFEHHIPADQSDSTVRYSVDPDEVKNTCVYGGAFTVTLNVREFFHIEPTPASGQVLHASIGENVNALHGHLLSHCDPLFLQVAQTANATQHTYTRQQPTANAFVKFSSEHGVDIVGKINVAKAEIPGVS